MNKCDKCNRRFPYGIKYFVTVCNIFGGGTEWVLCPGCYDKLKEYMEKNNAETFKEITESLSEP